ncbi:Stk1 family PASTA domain-containing Ser/Thr kinase [Arthrobacter sp. USHLN218]|uniref:Stk1 family PASTA domain-containing Ser/Thr kinase n=1 Tax=Arthrobacter sp. USHLN218 TaxID=3081232 RepID=UPI003017FE77
MVGATVDGRYLIQSRLARGGMSTVYLATDMRLDREVALKIMYPHLAEDPSFLERFVREAKSAARLSHPHVVGVQDQGFDGNVAYLAMEYVPGHTLRDVLREKGALKPRLALALLDPVVEGLAAAHSAGLVHRDVKPENVLMSSDGRIKIGDFGLAKAASTTSNTGTLIGTVAYLSPELVTGSPADARSDVYSVGIMLFEMLTGRQPFSGDVPIHVAFQHVNSSVPAPSSLVPGLAADLDELVLWCTAHDPEQRPIDANALLGELRHVRTTLSDADLDGHSEPAPPAAPALTEAVPAPNPTEVLGRDQNRTTVISPSYQHTQALTRPPEPAAAPAAPTKRQVRAQQRDLARQARRPEHSLRPNPGRRGLLWIIVLALLAILAAGAGWFFGLGPGAAVDIPAVSGKPAGEAQSLLDGQGLHYRLEESFHEQIEEGVAIGTAPPAGEQIRRFETLTLIVSKGPELFDVPALEGLTVQEAQRQLEGVNLALGERKEAYDEEIPAGQVLVQDPAAGEQLRRGTPVDVTLSRGPRPFDVPQVVGLGQEEAVAALQEAGLEAEIAPEAVFDRDVPEGDVAAQSPAEGSVVRGDTVTLTLSKGPRMVEVPDFVGEQVDDARQALEDLGFKVEVNKILGGFFGTVRAQDPAGKEAPEGSVVTLTVV